MNAAGIKTESSRLPRLQLRPPAVPKIPTAPVLSLNTIKRDKQGFIFLPPPPVDCFDMESRKGRFGWYIMEQHYIPYLVRNDRKYCSARIFEKTIATYITHLSPRIYFDCSNISSWYLTNAELALLTEINGYHCDFQFGRANFTNNDVLVLLDDASEFFKFLVICFGKLFGTKHSSKCGIIRLNNASPFPYVVVNKEQLVPLFFFEGIDPSTLRTVTTITGWPLAYLKFCFRVQGIREEFVKQEECVVATLDELKELFAPETMIEEFWPNCKMDENLVNKTVSNKGNSVWYRPPTNRAAPRVMYTLKKDQ